MEIKKQEQISEPMIFTTTVIETGDTLRVTIPKREAKFGGIEKDTTVKVWIRKVKDEEK